MSTFFFNGKPTFTNGVRKLPRNPPSWLSIFSIVPFHKIPLFSRDLITSISYSVSLFDRVIPEPNSFEIF